MDMNNSQCVCCGASRRMLAMQRWLGTAASIASLVVTGLRLAGVL